jgi:hypothetical protein
MKKLKILNLGAKLILLGFVFNIITSIYFAWGIEGVLVNPIPINGLEKSCDIISNLIIFIGVFLYITPLVEIYINSVKKLDIEEDNKDSL